LVADLQVEVLVVAGGVAGNWSYLRYNMSMNTAEIERLIREELAGKKMVPTVRVDLKNGPGFIASEENSVLKRLGENENGKLIVVKDSQVFEVEIRRK